MRWLAFNLGFANRWNRLRATWLRSFGPFPAVGDANH